MREKNIIPVFFAVDDNYAKLLAISLASIIKNASKEFNYKIIVLNTGLHTESKELLTSLSNENFDVDFYDVSLNLQKISSDLSVRDYYTKSTYYRLFIAELFTQYDKCLYLDCDTIIRGDIAELYNTDIRDNFVGAVPDASVQCIDEFITYVEDALGIDHREYYNAGVLIMNLKKMRDEEFENQFVDLISKYTFEVAQDQDYLNVLCQNNTYFLDGDWNQMPFGNYNKNVKLIHYNLSFKPWKYDDIMYEEFFWEQARELGLENDILEMKDGFTEEMKRRDILGGQRLKRLCVEEAENSENYYRMFVEQDHVNILIRFIRKVVSIYRKFVS